MVEIERLKIQKFKNGIMICKNVEELSKSLKSNIRVLKEVLESEDIKCRFEMYNGNILIKNLNSNMKIIKYIILRMLVFQNNVYMGYYPKITLLIIEKETTFKDVLEVEMFKIRLEIYDKVIKKILNKKQLWCSV